ncbi:hypothetical protein [Pediococcus pentosaceus]|nr:hypothetical protein [Pediococcus pentosaceus]
MDKYVTHEELNHSFDNLSNKMNNFFSNVILKMKKLMEISRPYLVG